MRVFFAFFFSFFYFLLTSSIITGPYLSSTRGRYTVHCLPLLQSPLVFRVSTCFSCASLIMASPPVSVAVGDRFPCEDEGNWGIMHPFVDLYSVLNIRYQEKIDLRVAFDQAIYRKRQLDGPDADVVEIYYADETNRRAYHLLWADEQAKVAEEVVRDAGRSLTPEVGPRTRARLSGLAMTRIISASRLGSVPRISPASACAVIKEYHDARGESVPPSPIPMKPFVGRKRPVPG